MGDTYFATRELSLWVFKNINNDMSVYRIDYHNSETVTISQDGWAKIEIEMQVNDDYGLQKFVANSKPEDMIISRFRHVKRADDKWYRVVEKLVNVSHVKTIEVSGRLTLAKIVLSGKCELDSISIEESAHQQELEHRMETAE